MKQFKTHLLTLAAITLYWGAGDSGSLSARQSTDAGRVLNVEVIMHRTKNGIAACGLGFKLASAKDAYDVNLVIEKTQAGTVTKLIATPPKTVKLVSTTVRTLEFSTQDILGKADAAGSLLVYSNKLNPDTVGNLFRQILVSGARIEVKIQPQLDQNSHGDVQHQADPGGMSGTTTKTLSWAFPGPAAQSLRSMYLMCSGDMYRP